MSYQDTKTKFETWCGNLKKEGLLDDAGYKKCMSGYENPSIENIDLAKYPESRTSKLHSFGMSDTQASNLLYSDLTKNKEVACFLTDPKQTTFLIADPATGKVAMKDDTVESIIESRNYEQAVFIIKLTTDGIYKILNKQSGKYLTIDPETKKALINTNEQNVASSFKLIQTGNNKYIYAFEAVNYPGEYLQCVESPHVSDSGEHRYWYLNRLAAENADAPSESSVDISQSRTYANVLLTKLFTYKMDYYLVIAQLEFVKLLRDGILSRVDNTKETGIIQYYKAEQDRLGLSNELLGAITNSIQNEVVSREGALLTEKEAELQDELNKHSKTTLEATRKSIENLMDILDNAIAEKRAQNKNLNSYIDSINAKTTAIIQETDGLEKQERVLDHKLRINEQYGDQIIQHENSYKTNIYVLIGAIIVMLAFIFYLGYKLYMRYREIF